ncbi:hypothetical protein HC251_10550 [Iamia sp. SCSIO 61187]|uniref:hypothetical protein n=1 Tax=Iamia sp. SCSIO 61187 TaxID=2722752 RepID=UPI001C631A37|nr:hypothetical protein [Iamia sp. SCSIO 61187]QYG92825.1 hypothetical protein HC251_10550 [Iamia sp. SCSIO 61187]
MPPAGFALRVAVVHRLLVGAVVAAALGAALAPGDPLATWLASWSGGSIGHGSAAVQTLASGAPPTVAAVGRQVSVQWDPLTLSGGTPVATYLVRRSSVAGVEQPVGAGCEGPVTGLSCVEADVPAGDWRYTVTPVLAPWIGGESPPSAPITVRAAHLVLAEPTTIGALPATLTGTVSGFTGGTAISFHLDGPTGPALAGTPAVVGPGGTATVSVTIPAGTDDSPHDVVVTGADGLVAAAAVTVVDSPTLTALEAFDVDGNGRLDRVTATFDEALAPYSAGTAPWTLTSPPVGASLSSVAVSGAVATLDLHEGTTVTTAVGGFRVALTSDASGVRDAHGHRSTFPATPVQDRAAPIPTAAPQMLDVAPADGKVDRVAVRMSESLVATAAGSPAVTLVGAPSGATAGAVTVAGPDLTIALAPGPGAPDTSVGSSTVALAATAGVGDAAGNPASFGPTTPRDGAAPYPVDRLAFDDDGDARIDRVAVTFSEPLAPWSAPTSVWDLGTVPSGGVLASVSVAGRTATLTLAEGAGPASTTVTPAFHIGIAAHPQGVRDAAGNQAAVTGGPATAVADRAPPVPLATTLLDVTEDGRVDRVVVVWTEPLAPGAVDVAPWTLAHVPSGGALTAVSVAGSTATLTITEGAGAADTAVGAMTVALTPSPAGVADAAGNRAGFAAVAPTDGARPVPVAVGGLDGAVDGSIEPGDTLTVTFSEPLAAASVPTATTLLLDDAPGGGNDTLDLPGVLSGRRDTGSTEYVIGNNRSAAFTGVVALSPDGTSVIVTVGSCAGKGCTSLGTATAPGGLSVLAAPTLTDVGGLAPTTTARTFWVRMF